MAINKHFLQDRTILLLLSFQTFLAMLSSILIMLRLNALGAKETYLVQFRSQPNAIDFATGGIGFYGTVWDIVSFIAAAGLFYVIGLVLAYRVYKVRRELSIVVLVVTIILLMFLFAVSNILLIIR